MMSQLSQPSSSISARVVGKNGAMPNRFAQYGRYENRPRGPDLASLLGPLIAFRASLVSPRASLGPLISFRASLASPFRADRASGVSPRASLGSLISFRASLASPFRADRASGVSPRASLGPLIGAARRGTETSP